MKVKDCMCKQVYYCEPNCTVLDCARIMNDKHVGCIAICNVNKNVVGIVTDRDIVLRCVANKKNAEETKISDIMSTNICCCSPEEDINEVENNMSKIQVKRIPVINDSDEFVGMVSLKDLAIHNEVSQERIGYTVEKICSEDKNNCF